MSSNHLMIVDGQPTHQIINHQIQGGYQQNSIAELVAIPQQQQQTIFYMDNSGTIPSELTTQVGTVELPIVLNHQLGNQVSLVQRQIKSTIATQQLSLMQQVQPVNSPRIIRTPASMPNQQLRLQMTNEQQNQNFIGTPVQQIANQMNLERSVQFSKQTTPQQFHSNVEEFNRTPLQKIVQHRERQVDQLNELGKQDASLFSDGRSVRTPEYQKQHKIYMPSDKGMSNPRNKTPSWTRTITKYPSESNKMRTQGDLTQGVQQQQPVLQQAPQREQTGTPQAQQQQQCRRNNPNYIIQPPKLNKQKQMEQRPLPSCVPSNQIKKIIENTPVTEEYSDSIRMLVMLANGEQRLITFTLPNQACTIQEILEQVGVPIQQDTPIEVSEANCDGINYIVTVGFLQNQTEETVESPETCNASTETQKEPESPQEEEQPKYIEGKMAVCGYCGILSDDFNKCMRCKTKLPDNVKAIPAIPTAKKLEVSKKGTSNSNGNNKDTLTIKKKVVRNKNSESEPVILTLSSDEEGDSEKPNTSSNTSTINKGLLKKLGSAVTLSPIGKEPSRNDIQKPIVEGEQVNIAENNTTSVSLHCRTVRIGSYRTIPKESVMIDFSSLTIKVATVSNLKEIVTIKIDRSEIVKVLISFQKQLPVFFYYLRASSGPAIRELLNMKEDKANYFDPLSENEAQRRIALLPENISEESKAALVEIYGSASSNILEELTFKEANDILMKICPRELTLANLQSSSAASFDVKLLFTYPPEGKGRISINTEDYMCLASDQFLNDVIIDFYLKYLVNNLTSEEQERIHVFSTFFYKRLTTKPAKASRKIQPAELDSNLSPSEKRHARVKTWTKNINLFEKDFVIVPINENSHWFLAIICFPGLEGCQTMEGQAIKIEVTRKKVEKNQPSTPVKKEEPPCEDIESDKDEAEGDESELDSDDSEEAPTITSHADRPPIKQPCILIFDSLAGARRSRIVATLRDYLTCEYKSKYNKEKIFNKDNIKGACPKVPQQNNFTDCGLYLLQYVEHFFMEPIKDYYIPIKSLKNWFDELTVTRKREDLSILIKSLMMEYDKNTQLLPDILFPTKNGVVVDHFAEDDEEMEDEMSDDGFHTPVVDSEHEMTATPQEEEFDNSFEICENADKNYTEDNDQSTQEVNESNKLGNNKDTLSYLKAKRIIRHKNLDSPSKKLKSSIECDD